MAIKLSEKELGDIIKNWGHYYDLCSMYDSIDFSTVPNDAPCKRFDQFYCDNGDGTFTGCDNTEGCCWCEDFNDEKTCIDWLEGRCDSEGNYFEEDDE